MIDVTSGVIATLLAEAHAAAPHECCGLLLGRGRRISEAQPAVNVAADPARRFEIDPAALLSAHKAARAGGLAVIGYYHSHPHGHPVPSATDCEHASGDARVWAIIAPGAGQGEGGQVGRQAGEVRFWRDGEAGFEALAHRISDAHPEI